MSRVEVEGIEIVNVDKPKELENTFDAFKGWIKNHESKGVKFIQEETKATIVFKDDAISQDDMDFLIDYYLVQNRIQRNLSSIAFVLVEDPADGSVEFDVAYLEQGQDFERIRRITGYLVGNLNRFNNAKRAEEQDRVKHVLEDSDDK